ncbi:MAG: hypothetical protein FJ314_10025 [SAR202 cluster bacterium]|nr:hypothetical protein [SAR202 cluster bacterium]
MLANRPAAGSIIIHGIHRVALWMAFLKSGVHPPLAGVLLAFRISRTRRQAGSKRACLVTSARTRGRTCPASTADSERCCHRPATTPGPGSQ